ncbi:MAG: CHASE2 domain-containing protein [Hyphomicrobium sp.]|uniref:CHASE2 domain-containing protein n=1 Tax=Hyphomicrobium sp. TaxID=82 RepID=UPI003D111BD7
MLVSAALALLLSALLHFPHGPQHWSADMVASKYSPSHDTQSDRIALVYVTDETLSGLTYTSPTDRQILADLVTRIDAAGARVIGLDFIFDRKTEDIKDTALQDAMQKARAKVVLGRFGGGPDAEAPDGFEKDFIAASKRQAGHLYFGEHHSSLVISDDAIRKMATQSSGTSETKSFAEVLADAGGTALGKGSSYIAWLNEPDDGTETFVTLSADTVLNMTGKTPPDLVAKLLHDKIVLVGGNFFDRDQHLIPFSVSSHHRYPGLFVHAQILDQFLNDRSIATIGSIGTALLAAAGAAIGFWAGRWSGNRYMLVELSSVATLILVGILTFVYGGLIFPYTSTLLAWIAGAAGGHYGQSHHG